MHTVVILRIDIPSNLVKSRSYRIVRSLLALSPVYHALKRYLTSKVNASKYLYVGDC